MQLTLDNVEQKVIVEALTDQIDGINVSLANSSIRDDEVRYARLTKTRAYLIALTMLVHNCGENNVG